VGVLFVHTNEFIASFDHFRGTVDIFDEVFQLADFADQLRCPGRCCCFAGFTEFFVNFWKKKSKISSVLRLMDWDPTFQIRRTDRLSRRDILRTRDLQEESF
jgi:hypothetical protein